ncbi:p115 like vesicle tethering protein [Fomitopsis serialis]|uniref:p115 like vesicle tethering protein n=1 Tax=Fomitopsis serialis TaxID=139415 RepID=UPI002008BA54|nr:p115 like vesicle tethering protein [Neoantrodia serialis]KAH9920972.1 p115 like vesicle tethering protein [Neoantrodia serialis]
MEFINQTYFALRGPQGAPQSAPETIARLADRLSPSTLLADRRAAVLSLKGLSRDHRADIGTHALSGLIDVLLNDAEIDADIGRAVLETLNTLCEADDTASPHARELGFRHTDQVLKDEKVAHKLFALLADHSFYLRVSILQFLSTLLQNRQAIFVVQSLISQSPEIQKILAFEGAFERLFTIVTSEGGIEGGIVVHDALACIDGLLRYNQSNQSYLRNSPLPPILLSILGFPPALPHDQSPPQGFALQLWDVPQKRTNTAVVVGIVGLLARSGGGNMTDPLTFAFTRCLIELGLASNTPTSIKTQVHSFSNAGVLECSHDDDAICARTGTNGEEWDRLEPASALDILVELILHGEYNGVLDSERRSKEGMELRAAALGVFQNFVQREEIAEAIVQAMASPPAESAPATPLLDALTAAHTAPLRTSPRAADRAPSALPSARAGGSFFVPADGSAPPPPPEEEPEQEEPQTLLQILSEHLSLAFLARGRADTSDREAREWDRLLVGYLTLLSQWLWEDPQATKQFLEAGALGILVEPINQMSETDTLVPALCVFLLGTCYEFNREPGEITRSTIHPILTRLGVDMLVGRVIRLRDDDRFKAIGPDTLVLSPPSAPSHLPAGPAAKPEGEEGEMWFDWAFADFWKSNYYTVQKGLHADPNSLSSSPGKSLATAHRLSTECRIGMGETAMLVASLKDVIRNQAKEIDTLRGQIQGSPPPPRSPTTDALREEATRLTEELRASDEKRGEVEKEQEDLLVLLDELNSKRRRDKQRMREAGMDVSEDEADDDDDEE